MNARLSVVVSLLLFAFAVTPVDAKTHKHQKAQKHSSSSGTAAAPAAGRVTVGGSVKNRAGHAVVGALVRLQHLAPHRNRATGGGPHVRTNRAGEFTLSAPVGRYALFASKPGVGSQRAFVTPSPGSVTRVTLIISPHHKHHHHKRPHHRRHVVPAKRVATPPGAVGTSTKP